MNNKTTKKKAQPTLTEKRVREIAREELRKQDIERINPIHSYSIKPLK
jgi:hypothetical protein